jgi:hypothetical protein
LHLLDTGDGYIVAKSLLTSKQSERDWAYNEEGYQYKAKSDDAEKDEDDGYNDKSFKYKSRIISKMAKDENENPRRINEKVVVYWSEKFEKRSMAESKSFLEFIGKLTESPANWMQVCHELHMNWRSYLFMFRVTATQAKSLKKFLRKEVVNEQTGEVLESSALKAMLDMGKAEEYKKGMGYYQIVTSELELDALEIIDKYHGLSRIEEQFRIMTCNECERKLPTGSQVHMQFTPIDRGNLNARPIFLSNPDHITAHLLICLVALIIVRIVQNRIVDSGLAPTHKQKKVSWSAGLSAGRIQAALNKWQVETLPGDYFRFLNIDDPDLKLILDAFNISIPYKLFQRAELRAIKSNIKVFM